MDIITSEGAFDEISRSRSSAMFAALGFSRSQHDGAVGLHGDRAVSRISLGGDEVPRPLGDVEQLLRRHPQNLDDQRQLIALVLASENGVT